MEIHPFARASRHLLASEDKHGKLLYVELHVLYRTYAGMNSKKRPEWFDRRVALQSLLQSLDASGVESRITFLVDGRRPADLEDFDFPTIGINGGNCAASFRGAIKAAAAIAADSSGDTLFWIAEDDYLYRPEAMSELASVARVSPQSAYLALHNPDDSRWHATTHPVSPRLPSPPMRVRSPHRPAGSGPARRR